MAEALGIQQRSHRLQSDQEALAGPTLLDGPSQQRLVLHLDVPGVAHKGVHLHCAPRNQRLPQLHTSTATSYQHTKYIHCTHTCPLSPDLPSTAVHPPRPRSQTTRSPLNSNTTQPSILQLCNQCASITYWAHCHDAKIPYALHSTPTHSTPTSHPVGINTEYIRGNRDQN